MQFLKKHYEKIVLSVVLLGLAVATAALPLMLSNMQSSINELITGVVKKKANPWLPVDHSTNKALVGRIEGPLNLELSGAHNLFNPVTWIKLPGDRKKKIVTGDELGGGALISTNIEPLKLVVSFEGVRTNADKLHYVVGVLRETGKGVVRPVTRSIALGQKGDVGTVIKVQGSAEDPTALMIELKGEKEVITVLKDKPYTRTIGYVADLYYPPEKQAITRKKVKDTFKLEGGDTESYEVVAITPTEALVLAKSTSKKYSAKLKSAP